MKSSIDEYLIFFILSESPSLRNSSYTCIVQTLYKLTLRSGIYV